MVELIGMTLQRVTESTVPGPSHVALPGRGDMRVHRAGGPPGAPTVVLLHGLWATGPLNWFPAFDPLRARFGVVATDLRGHGRGIPVDGRFHVSHCADDVAALVDALDAGPVILAGYSLGGVVAQLTWRRHPDKVAGLVLCATSRNFGGTAHERAFYRAMLGASVAAQVVTSVLERGADAARAAAEHADDRIAETAEAIGRPLPAWAFDELRHCDPFAAMGALAALGRFSSRDWIGDVDVPTAVVVTAHDRMISPVRQRKLAASIPGATVHEVAADHTACVLGARRFVPALVDACTSVADRLRKRAA